MQKKQIVTPQQSLQKSPKTHSKKLQYNEPKLTQNTEAIIFLLFKKIVKYQFLWRFHRAYEFIISRNIGFMR